MHDSVPPGVRTAITVASAHDRPRDPHRLQSDSEGASGSEEAVAAGSSIEFSTDAACIALSSGVESFPSCRVPLAHSLSLALTSPSLVLALSVVGIVVVLVILISTLLLQHLPLSRAGVVKYAGAPPHARISPPPHPFRYSNTSNSVD